MAKSLTWGLSSEQTNKNTHKKCAFLGVLLFSATCKINQVHPVLFPAACEFVSREKKKTISCSLVVYRSSHVPPSGSPSAYSKPSRLGGAPCRTSSNRVTGKAAVTANAATNAGSKAISNGDDGDDDQSADNSSHSKLLQTTTENSSTSLYWSSGAIELKVALFKNWENILWVLTVFRLSIFSVFW